MMDAILRAAGHRTGLYTSPHLVDFRERIRLDGAMIPEDAAAEGLSLLREAAETCDHAPTFFELVTVLAAWWLAREEAEYVVWETGMGGRLDATNAVLPDVAVITPIGLDHQKWLGDTLAQIAAEKAGIIKSKVPVVSAPQTAQEPAKRRGRPKGSTAAKKARVVDPDAPYGRKLDGTPKAPPGRKKAEPSAPAAPAA
jgi:dihydrofolate synthase/folylpolyglutamate synthase